jgi:hypothetical protein
MNCTALSDGYCLNAKLSHIGAAQLRDLDEYLPRTRPYGFAASAAHEPSNSLVPSEKGDFPIWAAIWPTWERSASPTTRSTLPCPTARSTGEHALDDT